MPSLIKTTLIPGVTPKVSYDGRRGRSGLYTVTLVRDPAKSGQALIGPAS
jgi:hypothetical protein